MTATGRLDVKQLTDFLTNTYTEVHLVAVLHLDGETHGDVPQPRGAGSLAKQAAFIVFPESP